MSMQRLDITGTRSTQVEGLDVAAFTRTAIDHNGQDQGERSSPWPRFGEGTGPQVDTGWMDWQYLSVSRTETTPLTLDEEESGTSGGYPGSRRFSRVESRTGDQVEEAMMTALADAVAHDDRQQFVRMIRELQDADWTDLAQGDFVRSVRWALQIGAHQIARELAQQGHARYPANATLAKLQRLTAPPRVLSERVKADPSIQKDQTWLAEASAPYRGQWVALKDGALVAAAPSAQALKAKLGTLEGYLVTRVIRQEVHEALLEQSLEEYEDLWRSLAQK